MKNNEETKTEEVKEEIKKQQSVHIQQTNEKKPGLYTAGLVCSIVGLCLFWSTWVGIICGVLGIVFGAVTFSKTNNKIPIILGSIATGLAIIMMIVYSVVGAKIYNNFKEDAKDIINESFEQVEKTTDIIDDAREEEEKRDAEFEQKTDEVEKHANSIQDDMNAAMEDVTKQAQDAFNNMTN